MVCRLLVAFLLVERSVAAAAGRQRARPLVSSAHALRRKSSHDNTKSPFLHRPRTSSASSRVLFDCRGGASEMSTIFRNECSTGMAFAAKSRAISETIFSTRGGATSSNTMVQTIVKSLLNSSMLPAPIKNAIEIVCQFIENLTGLGVLPRPEPRKQNKKKSKAKKQRDILVEEVSSAGATKAKTRRSDTMKSEDLNGDTANAGKKKRKRKSLSESPSLTPETRATTTATDSKPKSQAHQQTGKPKPTKPDAASKKFLSNDIKSSNPNYRIQRELKEFLRSPPPGLSVKISGKNVRLWVITLTMPSNTIYAKERYRLRVQFPKDYPTSPPSVYFLAPTPRHEHVYTNGDICLSLLGKDWRPIMTAQSIAQAIMSILCGAQRKSLPMDNARHAGNQPGKKQDDWVYHDDNC